MKLHIQFSSMKNLHPTTVRRLRELSFRGGFFLGWLDDREGWVSIARTSSGKVIGWSAVVPRDDVKFYMHNFIGIFVDEKHREMGVGRRLLSDLVRRTSWFLGEPYMASMDTQLFERVFGSLGVKVKDWEMT